jgi:hypothetical protein
LRHGAQSRWKPFGETSSSPGFQDQIVFVADEASADILAAANDHDAAQGAEFLGERIHFVPG